MLVIRCRDCGKELKTWKNFKAWDKEYSEQFSQEPCQDCLDKEKDSMSSKLLKAIFGRVDKRL
jgi:hypothetical protein